MDPVAPPEGVLSGRSLVAPWLVVARWSLDAHKYGHGELSRIGGLVGIIATILFLVIALGLT